MCCSVFSLLSQTAQIPAPQSTEQLSQIPSPPLHDSSNYPIDSGASTPTSGYASTSPVSDYPLTPESVPVEVVESKTFGYNFSPTAGSPHYQAYGYSPTANYPNSNSFCAQQQPQQPYCNEQQYYSNREYGQPMYQPHFCFNNYPQTSEGMTTDPQNHSLQQTICKVCGDTASGNHFGVQSCEACKSFFRRSIRANARYACRGSRSCAIEKHTRNRCQYCRLQKCTAMGMRKEGI